jgi:hypothetical protein
MHNALFASFAPIEGEPYSQAFEASFERVVPEAVHLVDRTYRREDHAGFK